MNTIIKIIVLITFLCCNSSVFANQYSYHPKNSIKQLFDQAIADNAFPGGCIVAGTAHQIFINKCFGYYTYARNKPDTIDSLFDLASLTKVISTTSAVMKLYEEGKIKLDDPVIKYLPEFKGPNASQTALKADITIRDLLAHVSGLPADSPVTNWEDVYATQLIVPPRTREIYSDINFLLLGKIIERVSGVSLAQYTNNILFNPLGMKSSLFKPGKQFLSKTVPTIYDFATDKYLTGTVNDPLAHMLGGVAGNAGLFSDAHDLTIFAQMMLNKGVYQGKQIFKSSTINLFTTRANIVSDSSRALGWDTAFVPSTNMSTSPSQFTAGLYINGDAYGHTGYTGVSLWISQKYDIFILLLTNRVSPYICDARETTEMYWRQRINSAIWENLGFTKKNILEEIPRPSSGSTLSECP